MYGSGSGAVAIQGGPTNTVPASVATPISPMQDARMGLTSAVNALHDRILALENRVVSACRIVPPPTEKQEQPADSPSISDLRGFLYEHSRGIEAASARIEEILNRLEL